MVRNLLTMTVGTRRAGGGGEKGTKTEEIKKKNIVGVSGRVHNDGTAPGRRSARECVRRPLSRNWNYRYGNTAKTPPWDYFYSIHMHAHTCQLQARRRPSPDGGELHNSRICLWPLKVCLKGLSNSQWTPPKNTERWRHAIWSHSLWANPFPGRSQNSQITISFTAPHTPKT